MKKNKIDKKFILYILFINIVISGMLSLLVEKFIYPSEGVKITRFLICIITFLFFLSIISLIRFYDSKLLNKAKKNCNNVFVKIGKIYNKYKSLIKYIFSFIITIIASLLYQKVSYLLFGICEIALIYFITDLFVEKHKRIAWFINDLLLLLYNINTIVLIFGSTFVNLIMLTNLGSLKDLSGKAVIYSIGVISILVFSFLPIQKEKTKNNGKITLGILAYEVILIFILGLSYSPLVNYGVLAYEEYSYIKMQIHLKNLGLDENEFLNTEIADYAQYKSTYHSNPNIILILTEGLSNHIIYDNRNMMPNIKQFSENVIKFENYYNHTAATYRGIIGQLYSGYQNNNLDSNSLVSVQSILSRYNYSTAFLNTEPDMKDFYEYLTRLGFDKVINKYKVGSRYLTDKKAYKQLYSEAIKMNKKSKPFFLAIYTFDTHVSHDSADLKFGKGKNSFMNKFYNVDYQFGEFIKKFNNSPLYDNTILIFTADHATYVDSDYTKTYTDYVDRGYSFMDEIPLFIYYKGIKPETIDVNGRNSLDLAPTILDFLDISEPNYFLGESLFSGKEGGTKYDSYYYENSTFLTSKDDNPRKLDKDDPMRDEIMKYLSISNKK